ncbi:hypothetical protein AMECASPLE_029914 [Ameca splendens]|uniref:Secreted protein n=1 Tax=Ameca splendens TaxID=208324 RepID=A0ABV0Z4M4_9TELE
MTANGAYGLVAAAPWGLCTVAAGRFPWDSPLLFSGGGYGSPSSGSPGVPVLWGAFGCLWLGSPPYLSLVRGGRSVAPHTHYCIFLWRNLVYTSTLTLRPTGV